ncbi:MAG: hypothetical protein HMLKMBBP_03621 [Planctomycetes bacterium]|nr:hypothetical protein [Planctomycetota bacterium]
MKQRQYLDVIDERTARARFDAACAHLVPRTVAVRLAAALGRTLAEDVATAVDVPAFDRSDVDGFAVRAEDTFGAEELSPRTLALSPVRLPAGAAPPDDFELPHGACCEIATGGMLPRGADAVVMIEHSRPADGGSMAILHAATPGAHVTFAGSDLGRGDVVLRAGTTLTSRETAMLAAVGAGAAQVFDAPTVAVMSTGDELVPPGEPLRAGGVYDSNQRAIADLVREDGGHALELGILRDDEEALAARLRRVLGPGAADVIVLSGGTSKGAGDLNYRVVERLAAEVPGSPGILVHGVALKPGKPLCLAVVGRTPVVILPGFPTSAVFTYREFVTPLVRRLAGRGAHRAETVPATLAVKLQSAVGRTDYQLVHVVETDRRRVATPLGAGSGSVSAMARADGFVRVPQEVETVAAGARVDVTPVGGAIAEADLVVVGSHCTGLDRLLSRLARDGLRVKSVAVGSQGGLAALARGEGDMAGIHLLDAATGTYNVPFVGPGTRLVAGYARRQGFVHRRGDARFEGLDGAAAAAAAIRCGARMVNRNAGSGTRVLIDGLLGDARPPGWHHAPRSHNAVAACVAQGRADWGVTLDVLAAANGLAFLPLRDERYDFAVLESRAARPGVVAFLSLLRSDEGRSILRGAGFVPSEA